MGGSGLSKKRRCFDFISHTWWNLLVKSHVLTCKQSKSERWVVDVVYIFHLQLPVFLSYFSGKKKNCDRLTAFQKIAVSAVHISPLWKMEIQSSWSKWRNSSRCWHHLKWNLYEGNSFIYSRFKYNTHQEVLRGFKILFLIFYWETRAFLSKSFWLIGWVHICVCVSVRVNKSVFQREHILFIL